MAIGRMLTQSAKKLNLSAYFRILSLAGGFVRSSRLLCVMLLLLAGGLWAQQEEKQLNVAVVPFVGDQNVTAEQLNFITGKFAAELARTQAFRVLDRGRMEYILQEQGFQQSGVCSSSECQVQMGQMLGVDKIISGNLVRFGRRYALRADFIDVATGQMAHSVTHNGTGDLEDVYEDLCKNVAQQLVREVLGPDAVALETTSATPVSVPTGISQTPKSSLSLKRKIALGLWGGAVIGAGSGAFFNYQAGEFHNEYNAAIDDLNRADSKEAYDNLQSATTMRNASYGVSIGTGVLGAVLWFWPEGK